MVIISPTLRGWPVGSNGMRLLYEIAVVDCKTGVMARVCRSAGPHFGHVLHKGRSNHSRGNDTTKHKRHNSLETTAERAVHWM